MTILRVIFYVLSVFAINTSFSQQQASNWYFGKNAGLNFNLGSGEVTATNNGRLNTLEGCATISDYQGNLLFYTDGTTVWDKNHNRMPNGFGLYGDSSSSQSAIIVPQPDNEFLFYIFTVDNNLNRSNFGLNYSLVDIRLNGGNGDVTTKNINLLELCSEKLTAVLKDCLTGSIWVIAFASDNGLNNIFNTFHAFEISNTGININSVKSTFKIEVFDARGNLKLSPDGTKVASANASDGLYIYDFNTQTGKLSNQQYLGISASNSATIPYGVEFSPNSTLLYVHASNDYFNNSDASAVNNPSNHFSSLVQFDMMASDIQASEFIVDSRNLYRGALQLGPNGKIYRALSATYTVGLPYLGVINNPNTYGSGCGYQHNAISLSPNNSSQGLPPFIASFFNTEIDIIKNGESSISLDLCDGDSYKLVSELLPGATYIWTKDDKTLPEADFDLDISEGGHYKVYIDPNNGDCALEGQAFIVYNSNPIAYDAILFQCDEDGSKDGRTVFNLNEAYDTITGGAEGLSIQYYNDPSFKNIIGPDAYSNISNPQTIYVEVLNTATSCSSRSSLQLEVSTTDANDVVLAPVCDDDGIDDGFYAFDLSEARSAVLDGLSNDLKVAYYSTYDDALLEQNQLPLAYRNTTAYNQTIYARAEDNNNCYGISTIDLTVNKLPAIETENLAHYCLNFYPETITLNAGILEGAPEDYAYEWSNGDTSYETHINDPGTYTVTVYNANGCSRLRTITVDASNIASINTINITDASQDNSVEVLASGEGVYEYAIYDTNNVSVYKPFQESPIFENIYPGIYTVRVKDVENDCGTFSQQISVIGFPKFFTPNNDGSHDFWQVLGVSGAFQANSKILIFDRYGKLMKQLDPQGNGWDGFFNGVLLPADDYWFVVTLQDGRTFRDHFTLKR